MRHGGGRSREPWVSHVYKGRDMKKLGLFAMPLVMVGMFALVGCGKNPQVAGNSGTSTATAACISGSTVTMGTTVFSQPSNGGCIQVSKGATVTFDDPKTGGGVHILCTGPDSGAYSATCVANSNAPSELGGGQGTTWQPGDKKDLTFNNAGTYNIVCTVHPDMKITVKVV